MSRITHQLVATAVALAAATWGLPAAAQSVEAARSAARKALQTNPEVTAKLNAYLSKIDAQAAAAAGHMPRLDLGADVGVGRSKTANIDSSTVSRGGANLTLSQVLWDGFATRNEVARTSHERLSRWFELVETTEQVALEATRAVYDVQRQRRLLALAEDNLSQHQQAATKLESRFKAGVGRGVDLDQARARLALAEANRDTELANLHDVAARYQRIVGESPAADMGSVELLRTGLPTSAEEAARTAVQRSAAIASGIESVRAARAAEAASRSAFQPQVSARAQVGAGHNLGGIVDRKSDASVGVVMNWNIFDGGGDRARASEKQKLVQQAMDLRDKACRDVRQTALIAFNDSAKLGAQLGTLGRNTAAIERARDAYRQQFEIGQRSLLDLLNAESESYTARRALTNAAYDRALAYARTLAATTQLTTQLGIARDLLPPDASNWTAGGDAAARCPTGAVDVTALRPAPEQMAQMVNPLQPVAAVAPAAPAMLPATALPVAVAAAAPMARALPAAAVPLATRNTRAVAQAQRAPVQAPAQRLVEAAPTGPATRLENWAQAWRTRNNSGLNSLYAPGYKGSANQNPLWKQNAASREPLDLEVEEITSREMADGSVETRFRQSLLTFDGVEVNDMALTWRQFNGQWRIVRERRV